MVADARLAAFAVVGAIVCARANAFPVLPAGHELVVFVVAICVAIATRIAVVFTPLGTVLLFVEACGPDIRVFSVEWNLARLSTAGVFSAEKFAAVAGLIGLRARRLVGVVEAAGRAAAIKVAFVDARFTAVVAISAGGPFSVVETVLVAVDSGSTFVRAQLRAVVEFSAGDLLSVLVAGAAAADRLITIGVA